MWQTRGRQTRIMHDKTMVLSGKFGGKQYEQYYYNGKLWRT